MNDEPAPAPDKQPIVILTTPRLILRAVVEADISPLYQKIFGVPEVMSWVFAGKALSRAETERFIRANFNPEATPIGLFVLADRTSGEVMGFAGLNPCQVLADDDLEFGSFWHGKHGGGALRRKSGRRNSPLDSSGSADHGCSRWLPQRTQRQSGRWKSSECVIIRM